MAMPSQTDIELPLLLELERLGGRARKGKELYYKVASHFPKLTQEDLERTRESTKVNLWGNNVDWARNKLRERGELNGGEWGIWEMTDAGRRRLRTELQTRGLTESVVTGFINSSQTLPQALGERWQPIENLVGAFLEAKGFQELQVSPPSRDGGVDGECIAPFIDVKIAFQAKRFKPENAVGAPMIQQFKGSFIGQ